MTSHSSLEARPPAPFRMAALTCFIGLAACSGGDGGTGPEVNQETGNIEVTVSTQGVEQDADGYTLTLDGGSSQQVGANGSLTFSSVSARGHTIEVAGLAVNCDPEGGTSRNVSVSAGATASVSIVVNCTTKPLIFTSSRSGDFQIYRMNLDGSGIRQLTTAGGWGPRWSPDGAHIAFLGTDDPGLWVMNADGSGLEQVVDGDAGPPDWSPDGTRLVFSTPRGPVLVVNLDGSGLMQLSEDGLETDDPEWGGPAGAERIVYSGAIRADGEVTTQGLFMMDPDGGNNVQLTTSSDFQPSFSPDGTMLVFSSDGRDDEVGLYIMPVEGGEVTRRTSPDSKEVAGRWSPDGSQLTFTTLLTAGSLNQEVCIGSSSSAGATNLTQNEALDLRSDWRPTG